MLRTHPDRWTHISAPGDSWLIYQRSDGKQLTAAALEEFARQILGPRLASISKMRLVVR